MTTTEPGRGASPRIVRGLAAGVLALSLMVAGVSEASAAPVTGRTATATTVSARTGFDPYSFRRAFCGIPIVNHFIPACSNGMWEPIQVKLARCIEGHAASYHGWLGPAKLVYWTEKCAAGDWQKW